MGKTILFSPVGGTDPLSRNNLHDGALIHICRIYKPDKIYMYMSSEIMENESRDSRYTYCLKKLYEYIEKELDYSIIERPELTEVQDFDLFYDDFRKELGFIIENMDEGDELLLNTSSGTPAMKSALVVLVTVGDVKARLIQVATPEKRMNSSDSSDYEVEVRWETYIENTDTFVDRSKEITCRSLLQIKNEEMVKHLVRAYDYPAAIEITNMMDREYTSEYNHLLEYACFRQRLDNSSMTKMEVKYDIEEFLPVRTSKYRNAVEYALTLFIKVKRKEYGDFVRALTPLILELFILILDKSTKVNARDYCYKDSRTAGYKWAIAKVEKGDETKKWFKIWNEYFKEGFIPGYLQAIHLLLVIERICNPDIVKKAQLLRTVEENVRNNAAHEIALVNEETVVALTDYSCDQIIDAIKSLFKYVGVDNCDSVWNSYEKMNSIIIDKIGNT